MTAKNSTVLRMQLGYESVLRRCESREHKAKPDAKGSFLAIVVSILWNLYALGFFAALISSVVKIEDAKLYFETFAEYLSFIPTSVISYYFGSVPQE